MLMGTLTARCPRPGLVAARERLGLTQDQAAAAFGVATSTWARWERGETDPRPDARAQLVDMFGVTPKEVERWITGEDAQPPFPWLSSESGHMSLAATVEVANELWRWDVGIDASRRRILAALPFVPAVLNEWLVSWAYDPPELTRAHASAGSAVGMEDVQRINEARQAFSSMDHQFGGGLVRPAVVDYLNTQVTPLLAGTYTDRVGKELLTAAASMTELAGWEAYDLGRHGLAQAHYGQALRLAKAADDPLAASHVLAMLAQQACDLHHPEEAVRLARAARHAGEEAQACPRVRARQIAMEARATAVGVALAETFDGHAVTRVHQLIGQTEKAFAAANPNADDEPAWAWDITSAEVTAEIGHCWRMIGEHARAEACTTQALRGFGSQFLRSVQLNTVHLAQALTGKNELDAALHHARAAVPMAQRLKSTRCTAWIREFDRGLEPHAGEPAVREWRAYLRHELSAA
jgi:transcriptional regulator with XRE-family HTH domain/tetratricopeptide (TPR) repeat protein